MPLCFHPDWTWNKLIYDWSDGTKLLYQHQVAFESEHYSPVNIMDQYRLLCCDSNLTDSEEEAWNKFSLHEYCYCLVQ